MKIFFEVIITTILLIVLTRVLYLSQHLPFIGSYYATIFAILFLYVPIMVLFWKKRKIDFLDNSFSSFGKGVLYFLLSAIIVFPPYLLAAHFWEVLVYGKSGFSFTAYPDLSRTIIFQLLFIALPEEFFFRGYMQGSFDLIFKKRWRILGINLGWSWILTAFIFAFSHSFVKFQWWHFSIFFPALLFGWLKEKTNSITAPVFFHALCNIVSDWLARAYF